VNVDTGDNGLAVLGNKSINRMFNTPSSSYLESEVGT